MAIQEVLVSKIFNYTSEPTKKVEGQFWFNPSTNILSRYNGTAWKAITVGSDDVAVLSDGNKISLTNYLNTQIAALAEGIDSKQDKLTYYSENTTNQTANISINKSSISLAEAGITLTVGNSADLGNNKLSLTTSLLAIDCTSGATGDTVNLLTIQNNARSGAISALSGDLISKSITSSSTDTQLPTSKAVKTELDKKQNQLHFYSETNDSAEITSCDSFNIHGTTEGLVLSNNTGGITVKSNVFKTGQAVISLSENTWGDGHAILFDFGGQQVAVEDALLIPEIKDKQSSTDNTLETSSKTIVGAINEINSIFNVNALPTPITDIKTITTTLENLIIDTQYANKPGTILINPNIKNTGAILVGEAITDISKAFPIYTDQPVTIAFKNINDFKVAGENAGESFNYIISFGYINQSISTNA